MRKFLIISVLLAVGLNGFGQENSDSNYFELGNIEADSGNYEGAIKYYSIVIDNETDQISVTAYFNRASARHKIGDFKGAVDDLDEVILFSPKDGKAYYNRACALSQLNKYNEAIIDYNMAEKYRIKDEFLYYNRGNSYYSINNFKMALSNYDKAIKKNPNDDAYFNNRGLTKIELKDKEGACNDWAKALQLGHLDAQYSLEKHCK